MVQAHHIRLYNKSIHAPHFTDPPHESVSKVRMIHNLQTDRLFCCTSTTGNQQSIPRSASTFCYHTQSKDCFDDIHVFERPFTSPPNYELKCHLCHSTLICFTTGLNSITFPPVLRATRSACSLFLVIHASYGLPDHLRSVLYRILPTRYCPLL